MSDASTGRDSARRKVAVVIGLLGYTFVVAMVFLLMQGAIRLEQGVSRLEEQTRQLEHQTGSMLDAGRTLNDGLAAATAQIETLNTNMKPFADSQALASNLLTTLLDAGVVASQVRTDIGTVRTDVGTAAGLMKNISSGLADAGVKLAALNMSLDDAGSKATSLASTVQTASADATTLKGALDDAAGKSRIVIASLIDAGSLAETLVDKLQSAVGKVDYVVFGLADAGVRVVWLNGEMQRVEKLKSAIDAIDGSALAACLKQRSDTQGGLGSPTPDGTGGGGR